MGDAGLGAKLDAFMEEMTTRQRALEKHIAELSKLVLGKGKDQNSNEPLGELANLKQTNSVEEYQSQFQSLVARTCDLTPRNQVSLFIVGLKEDIRGDIELQQPGNLGIAIILARALERKQGMIVTPKISAPTPKSSSTESGISTQKSSNTESGNSTQCLSLRTGGQSCRPSDTNASKVSSSPLIKRLKRPEMAEGRIAVIKRLKSLVMAERRIAACVFILLSPTSGVTSVRGYSGLNCSNLSLRTSSVPGRDVMIRIH